jgi:hypothetical protein
MGYYIGKNVEGLQRDEQPAQNLGIKAVIRH